MYTTKIQKRPRSYYQKDKRAYKKQKNLPRVVTQQLALRRVRPEFKAADESQTGVTVTSTPAIVSITQNMAHSTGTLNSYIGSSVDPQSLQIRFHLVGGQDSLLSPLTSDSSNNSRITIVQWLADSIPIVADIYQNTAQPSLSPWNVNNLEKMNVLYDQLFPTYLTCFRTGVSGNLANSNSISEKAYVKGKKISILRFNNAGNTTEFGDIYFIYCSDSSATPHPTISWHTRLTYTD